MVTLTADGLTVSGNPRITVLSPSGHTVKSVDKTDAGQAFVLILDEHNTSIDIGLYLPADVEGAVSVHAELVGPSCVWSGDTTDAVQVKAGETATTMIKLMPASACAASTIADGGASDAGDAGDVAPMLDADGGDVGNGRDGGDGPINIEMKCADYCFAYTKACLPTGSPERFTCLGMCEMAKWPEGIPASTHDNTFACRWDHLKVVTNDAALSCSECYAASPESPGICGPPPDAGGRDACPLTD